MRVRYDWAEVQRFYDAGNGRNACVERFGFTLSCWYKAIRLGRIAASVERRTVDWTAVQNFYDQGHTFQECRDCFGFASLSWTKAVRRGALRTRPLKWPIDRVLSHAKSRITVKRRLLGAGILKNVCDFYGLSEWREKPLSIQLDHANGVRDDNRLENLRMLCPNCHSQTETFGSKNRKKIKTASLGPR